MDELPSPPTHPSEGPAVAPQPPPPPPLPTPVMPLDYSPREQGGHRAARVVSFLRRFVLATGTALMAGSVLSIMFPRYDEEVMFFSIGLGLCLLAVPLPKLPGW